MKRLPLQGRTLALLAVVVPLLALFVYVALRSGPLAPVKVTVATVETKSITPALFGIGTVEARRTYRIGPMFTGRVKRLDVEVGERVKSGQVLGEMEPVDLDQRIRSQDAALKRAKAALSEAEARHSYAETQLRRFEKLFEVRSTSEESVTTKRQELRIADAGLSAAREELSRVGFDREALEAQRANLKLVAPVDGLVAQRNADPGTTVVAGQAVVEVIDPRSLWINTRFDQISAAGLASDLPARVALRSRSGQQTEGRVLRVEPMADAVTEELLAKVTFEAQPELLPPVGELAEVTVDLPALTATLVIPNAAIRRVGDSMGVWRIVNGGLQFTPVELGASDLDGLIQVKEGINSGDQFVVYSEKALTARLRVHVVEHMPGVSR